MALGTSEVPSSCKKNDRTLKGSQGLLQGLLRAPLSLGAWHAGATSTLQEAPPHLAGLEVWAGEGLVVRAGEGQIRTSGLCSSLRLDF